MNDLDSLVGAAQQSFAASATPAELENAKAQFLGKAGRMTELMKGMAQLSPDEKKSRGAAINLAKQAIEAALAVAEDRLKLYATFDHVLDLIREKRDMTLLFSVEAHVRLAKYSPGRIEFEPTPDAPRDFTSRNVTPEST